MMEYTYVTFGQIHKHEFGNQVIDKDCVARVAYDPDITDDRTEVFKLFGVRFYTNYSIERIEALNPAYFPRGIIELDTVLFTCHFCSEQIDTGVEVSRYVDFRDSGQHIQDFMPEVPEDIRELFISGICGKCFDKTFGEER